MAKNVIGWVLFLVSIWMFTSPQSLMGLKQLKWMYNYAFPGEILVAILLMTFSIYLLDLGKDSTKREG